ncbi:MAG: hypothetical protein ACRC5H_02475 [Treponemataceae bacterium]
MAQNFYCEYCGTKYPSLISLTSGSCNRHPSGIYRGKHKFYEGGEKPEYSCKYCGEKHSSIASLTSASCNRHPAGIYRGKHAPAL